MCPVNGQARAIRKTARVKGKIMSALMGIWTQIVALATTTDVAMLIVAVLIIIATGLLTPNPGAIVTATVGALVVFGLCNYAQGVVFQSQNAVASADADWQKLMDMHGNMLIAYFVCFLVLISLVFGVRKVIFQR